MISKETLDKIIKNAEKIYFAKIGNAHLVPKELSTKKLDDKYFRNPSKYREYFDLELIKGIFDASPTVKKTSLIHTRKKMSGVNVIRDGWVDEGVRKILIRSDPILKIQMTLPEKNQPLAKNFEILNGKKIHVCTDFEIFYDWCNYLILSEIDSKKFNINFVGDSGADVRNQIEKIFENNNKFSIEIIPPTPLRQRFYFIFLKPSKKFDMYIGKTFVVNDDKSCIYSILPSEILGKFDFYFALRFGILSEMISVYYLTNYVHDELEYLETEVKELHSSVQNNIKEINNLKLINFIKRSRLLQEIQTALSGYYSKLAEYSNLQSLLKRHIDIVKDIDFGIDGLFTPILDDLIQEFRYYPLDLDLLEKSMGYARESMQKVYSKKVTIIAVIVTAIFSILGTIILHYFGF